MTDKQHVDEELDETVFITLTLEDGEELKCEFLGILEYKDKEYIAVLPENDEEFWIYEYSENDDETFEIDNVEDEAIFAAVGKLFEEQFDAEDAEYEDEDDEDENEDDEDDEDDDDEEKEHDCDCEDCDCKH
ncbi:MAG: DUF1292 domain-containing protein [Candidatus Cloacimonadales bacterium]